ncbi:MAG: 23S rRNA (adenine(2503)-C(2))-methyltransferase RlmN [Coriobacteriia bacterium]|nr:23S rRNA (adenine(2503)-C(2))-methyltransferase RlmN [Coriobacteriia bacterium]
MKKKDIKTYSLEDLKFYLEGINESSFHANQILEWLYLHQVCAFDSMTNLSKNLREILSRSFDITELKCKNKLVSADESAKYVFECVDGSLIETVSIPQNNKITVCVSSQVGCSMACSFCATGTQGFSRNLSIGEIVDQVLYIQNNLNKRVSNIVVMGQGEPFLNYENVISALSILSNPKTIAIGSRKITVSTCGIIPGINKFALQPKQYGLAVSLHSAIQNKRNKLMPGVKKFSLERLKETIKDYQTKTNRRITFEYLLLKNINDQEEDLKALIDYCKGIHRHINLLKYNKTENSSFEPSNQSVFNEWLSSLKAAGINATIRQSRGADIDGACGQLVSRETF